MATQTRDWIESVPAELEGASAPARALWVADGVLGHYAEMAPKDTVAALLDDYAAGYDAGDEPHEITVEWSLYDHGECVDSGEHTWDYPIR
jgi:hypothetical protein